MSRCMNALAGKMYKSECPQLSQRDHELKQKEKRIYELEQENALLKAALPDPEVFTGITTT